MNMITMPNFPNPPRNLNGIAAQEKPKTSLTGNAIAKIDGMTDRQQAAAFSYLTGCFMTVLKPNAPIVRADRITELFNNAVKYGITQ